jgi:hypothetical protein
MSCGIALGFALVDLAIFLLASGASGVALGAGAKAAADHATRDRIRQAIREAALEAFGSEEIVESEAEEIERLIAQGGADGDFGDAQVLVRTDNDDIIGLKQDKEGIYQVVAKWRPSVEDRLRVDASGVEGKYRQRYAYLKIKKEAEKLGYQVAEEEILPDQSIRVRVRRWD